MSQKSTAQVLAVALATATLTGCEVVGGIFKAGMWVGVLGIGLLVAVIALFAGMFRRA